MSSPCRCRPLPKPTHDGGSPHRVDGGLTMDHLTACRLTRSTRRPSSSSLTLATRTRAPSTCRGLPSSRPSFPCSPVRHLPLCRTHAPGRVPCLQPKDACLRSPTHLSPRPVRSCTTDGVHEEGDLPQPVEERDRHGQHPRGRRQHCRALPYRVRRPGNPLSLAYPPTFLTNPCQTHFDPGA